MKKYLFILFFALVSIFAYSQPVVNRANSANTVSDARLQAGLNFYIPRVQDTTAANTTKGIDSCGALIYNRSTNSIWYRACSPKRWLPLEGGNGEIDLLPVAGQSNAVGNSTNPSAAIVPTTGTAFQFYNNAISAAVEPIGNSNGSAWGAFAASYYKLTSRKVCFVPCAVNGSSMASAAQVGFGTWDTTGTLYATSVLRIDSALAALVAAGFNPVFKGILWCQGETDADGINGSLITEGVYSAAFAKLIKNYRLTYGNGISFNISRIGYRVGASRTGYAQVQNASVALANPDSLINVTYWNAALFLVRGLMVDQYHYTQPGYNEMGRTMAEEYVNSTSNSWQVQAGTLFIQKNVAIGDTIPTSPLHIYRTGNPIPIQLTDSMNNVFRLVFENKQDGNISGTGPWFYNHRGLRSQIVHTGLSSIIGPSILAINSTDTIAINSDLGDVNISTGLSPTNLVSKAKVRVKNNGGIGIGAAVDPVASALVQMVSTTRGLSIPTMTGAQMTAISSPATGLMVWCTDSTALCEYTGTEWRKVDRSGGGSTPGFQAVLAVNSDMSQSNTVDGNNFDFQWDNFNNYIINPNDFEVNSDGGITLSAQTFIRLGGDEIDLNADSVRVFPLTHLNDTVNSKPVVADVNTGTLRKTNWPVSSVTWNAIISPTGDQALTFQAGESSTWTDQNTTEDLFTVNNATSTTNSLFSLNRTSTALAAGNNMMELVSSGSNASSTITANGLSISLTNSGTTSTNNGLVTNVSGATYNYDIFTNGRVSVGAALIAGGASDQPAMIIRQLNNTATDGIYIYPNANYSTNMMIGYGNILCNSSDFRITASGGSIKLNSSTGVFLGGTTTATAAGHFSASSTSRASGRIETGTAPTSPNAGDFWVASNNWLFFTNSTTYTLAKTLTASATLNFPDTAPGTTSDLTITVTGAADGQSVVLGVPNASTAANSEYTAWVSAANTVTVRFANIQTVGNINPASGTFTVSVLVY